MGNGVEDGLGVKVDVDAGVTVWVGVQVIPEDELIVQFTTPPGAATQFCWFVIWVLIIRYITTPAPVSNPIIHLPNLLKKVSKSFWSAF